MNFTSQICTTKEQSERLLALGLKAETADMTYLNDKICTASYNEMECPYDNLVKPSWSLHRLIELCAIPKVPFIRMQFQNTYDEIISLIAEAIKLDAFNKEYLEE